MRSRFMRMRPNLRVISYVGSDTVASAAAITMPGGIAAGDLAIVYAFSTTTTPPTAPSGYTSLTTNSASGSSHRVSYKILDGSETTFPASTGSACAIGVVYRGIKASDPFGGEGNNSSNSSTDVIYPALSPLQGSADIRWCIRFGARRINDSSVETPPTGYTNRASVSGGGTSEIAAHDSDAIVASVTSQTVTAGGTASNYLAVSLELI